MKYFKSVLILLFVLAINSQVFATIKTEEISQKSAETVFEFAKEMNSFDAETFKLEFDGLSSEEKVKLIELSLTDAEQAALSGAGDPTIGYYILAVLLPPAAVGIYTDWSMPTTLYSVGWTILGFLPGVIHAFIVLGR